MGGLVINTMRGEEFQAKQYDPPTIKHKRGNETGKENRGATMKVRTCASLGRAALIES